MRSPTYQVAISASETTYLTDATPSFPPFAPARPNGVHVVAGIAQAGCSHPHGGGNGHSDPPAGESASAGDAHVNPTDTCSCRRRRLAALDDGRRGPANRRWPVGAAP